MINSTKTTTTTTTMNKTKVKSGKLSTTPTTVQSDCWALALGYPCCQSATTIYSQDEAGDWSIENETWCGIN